MIGIVEGEFVHSPRLVLGLVYEKSVERCGEFIYVFGVEVKAERIVAGHEPAFSGGGEMKFTALSIGQDAVALVPAMAGKAELGVERFAKVEVVAGNNRGQGVGTRHSNTPNDERVR